ncbi:GntR family transcriptional regulator [Anaerosalibacter bizertensis]|uniref:GntR family transcriptional regulator n=1 Tax=Anaerosalibacter bizertensis TaxID=932217 RepID=UPI001C0EC657|nr:GntR family transcriptional regulator [Anaerosalibacter bizertensis]MBU5293810.1 GntR family transcriptional regulator [Anaerosalibacter bizertensis]
MIIKIDFESEIPIYEQLKRQIIQGIAKGDLSKGEELPSVRQLAEDIGINLHTVNKSYNLLKDEGYLVVDRRKGTRVSDTMPEPNEKYIDNLKEEIGYISADAYCKGIRKEEFLSVCEKYFNDFIDNGEDESNGR